MTDLAPDLREWLRLRVADLLDRSPNEVSVRALFADLGLSSLHAVELSGDLQDHLGCALSPTLFFDYPTIEELAVGVTEADAA